MRRGVRLGLIVALVVALLLAWVAWTQWKAAVQQREAAEAARATAAAEVNLRATAQAQVQVPVWCRRLCWLWNLCADILPWRGIRPCARCCVFFRAPWPGMITADREIHDKAERGQGCLRIANWLISTPSV